jgi:hypothetical protein
MLSLRYDAMYEYFGSWLPTLWRKLSTKLHHVALQNTVILTHHTLRTSTLIQCYKLSAAEWTLPTFFFKGLLYKAVYEIYLPPRNSLLWYYCTWEILWGGTWFDRFPLDLSTGAYCSIFRIVSFHTRSRLPLSLHFKYVKIILNFLSQVFARQRTQNLTFHLPVLCEVNDPYGDKCLLDYFLICRGFDSRWGRWNFLLT